MIKKILLLLLIFMSYCCVSVTQKKSKSFDYEVAQDSTIVVHNVVDNKMCTGAWVSDVLFLTAAHCNKGQNNLIFYSLPGDVDIDTLDIVTQRPATVIAYDDEKDLILAYANPITAGFKHSHFKISNLDIKQGDQVHAYENSHTWFFSYFQGRVSQFRLMHMLETKKRIKIIQTTTAGAPGGSGGPLINEEGELIGILSRVLLDVQNVSFYVHRNVILQFVVANNIDL